MDTSHLYMFVDYDGVVKTYAENFPDELHDENMPFSMSMIRVLSNIAGLSGLPAYFMPISSSPGLRLLPLKYQAYTRHPHCK